MADAPQAPSQPEVEPGPFGRPLILALLCAVNVILAVPPLIRLIMGPIPPPPPATGIPPLPEWFRPFGIAQSLALISAAVGLWFFKRWGFALLALAYATMVLALVIAHQVWVCAAMIQFPLFALASRQWKHLK